MSLNDLLSQDEIDALLHGVSSGDVETEADDFDDQGGIRSYNFASQDRIVRARLPALETINERFARYFRLSLFNMMRRSAEISIGGVQMLKFSEYVHSLFVPTSLNLVRVRPLRGTALLSMDPRLVFVMVDNFFGGGGRLAARTDTREFTPTEMRVVQLLLEQAFKDLKESWAPAMDLDFEYLDCEVNPHLVNIASPTEVVVVSSFHIETENGTGDLHVTFPYSMLEPIRDVLDADIQGDRSESDGRWQHALREEVKDAEIEISSVLTEAEISLRQLMALRPGDVIPIELPESVTLRAENIPLFRGKFGVSGGHNAIELVEKVRRG
jgi:flagellar motor switch protein FliM